MNICLWISQKPSSEIESLVRGTIFILYPWYHLPPPPFMRTFIEKECIEL